MSNNKGKFHTPNNSQLSSKTIANQEEMAKQRITMHQLLENRTSKLRELKNNDLCYLLSTKWLQDWKDYVAYDQITAADSEQKTTKKEKKYIKRHPGKINVDIIAPSSEGRDYYPIPQSMPQYQYLNERVNDKKIKENDFIAVTQDIWQAFSNYYEGEQIRRTIQITKTSIFYEGELLKCDLIFAHLEEAGLQQKIKKCNKRNYCSIFSSNKVNLSTLWTFEQLSTFLTEYCEAVYNVSKIRIWKGFSYWAVAPIIEMLVESIKDQTYLVKGRELTEQRYKDKTIDEYIKPSHTIIVETSNILKTDYSEQADIKGYCEQCVLKKSLTISCMCNEVIYCTNKCRTNDQTYHYQTCSQAFDSEDDEDFTQLSVDLTPQTGLHNIGNSCYMNSIVQALVSLDGIRSFFSTNQYLKHLNEKELKENSCMFLHKFSKTIKALIQNEESFPPWPLKSQIDYNLPSFKGDKQHDANDFLVNFLNLLNDHFKKPESKAYHSVLEPLVGEFYSKVLCPHCKGINENTQIFLQISLPIKSRAPQKQYQYAVVQSLQSVRKGKARVADTWRQMKADVNAKSSLVCISKQSAGVVIVDEQKDNPQRATTGLKGDLIYYKDLVIPQGHYPFVFSLVTIKTIIGNKMKSAYGIPIILTLCDQQKTLGTFWLQIIKAFFPNDEAIKAQAELIEKQYFIQIESSIVEQSKIASENQTELDNIAADKQSERCNRIVENFNKRLKIFADKIGIEVYINDYQRNRSICKFCNKRCSNCELPKIFDKGFDDFFAEKYNEVKFQVYLREYLDIQYKNQEKSHTGEPSIHDCLELFAQPEELDEQNAYYCEKCDSMGLALKELHVKTYPSVLVLHLNRFKTVEDKKVKNNDAIQYKACENFGNQQYRLISAIIHEGSMEAGHYWCISLRNGEYYTFNDSKVAKIQNTYHRNAYILIYELISQ